MVESFKILKSLMKHLKLFLIEFYSEAHQRSNIFKENNIIKEVFGLTRQDLINDVKKGKPTRVFTEFMLMAEIEGLRKNDRCKYKGRNMLGVRKFDDWINNLEIGNIMHLNPITTNELM